MSKKPEKKPYTLIPMKPPTIEKDTSSSIYNSLLKDVQECFQDDRETSFKIEVPKKKMATVLQALRPRIEKQGLDMHLETRGKESLFIVKGKKQKKA